MWLLCDPLELFWKLLALQVSGYEPSGWVLHGPQ